MSKIYYVIEQEDKEKMQEIIRQAFRAELGIEIEFVEEPDGTISVMPAKGQHA